MTRQQAKKILEEKGSIIENQDFSGMDLNNLDLANIKLINVSFKNANLKNTNFSYVITHNVDFSGANFENSKILECLIEWEDLMNVVVTYNTEGEARCKRLKLLHLID